jgi:hypothetical protein
MATAPDRILLRLHVDSWREVSEAGFLRGIMLRAAALARVWTGGVMLHFLSEQVE